MAATFLSGCGGRVLIGPTALTAHRWSITERVEELDVTSGANAYVVNSANPTFGLYRALSPGIKEAQADIEAYWDSNTDIFGQPPYLVAGSSIKNVRLQPSQDVPDSEWFFYRMLVCSVSQECDVRGIVKYILCLKNDGVYAAPGLKGMTETAGVPGEPDYRTYRTDSDDPIQLNNLRS